MFSYFRIHYSHNFPQGFIDHVKHDHSMWNYMYYYVYLDQMDPNDYTAIDTYVYRKVYITKN